MTISFSGILRIDQGKFRTTQSIKGFGGTKDNKTRIRYNDGKSEIVPVRLDEAVYSYAIAENETNPIDLATGKMINPETMQPYSNNIDAQKIDIEA